VLLALVDAEYRFIAADISQYGSSSDGGVFNHSATGEALHQNKPHLPKSARVSKCTHPHQINFKKVLSTDLY